MKILEIHDFFAPGNSRYSFDKCRALAKLGHEIHVLAGVGPLGPANGTVGDGILFHTYPYTKNMDIFTWNRKLLSRLEKEFHFDLLFFNQPLCCFSTMTTLKAWGVKRAYFFHSPWREEYRIQSGLVSGPRLVTGIAARTIIEAISVRYCNFAFTTSKYMYNQFKRIHPFLRPPLAVGGGVDEKRFYPRGKKSSREKLGLKQNDVIIFTMRRLVKRMGLTDLIEAISTITKQLKDVFLVIGGDGPMRKELEALTEGLGITGRVRFTGYITDEDLPYYYSAADLVVVPTRELEGLGLVVLEAMACGTVVAGTAVGGIKEILNSFDNRFLFSSTGQSAIAEGIEKLVSNGLLSMGEAAREWVIKEYNWDRVANTIENAILR